MDSQSEDSMQEASLAVGDPRRRAIGSAVVGTFLAGALFMVFTIASKEFPALYLHTPWENDPYDTAVSFAIFFVPLISGVCLVPLMLVKRSEPLASSRIRILLRSCGVVISVVVITLVSDWVSVGSSANLEQWTGTTRLLITLLTAITIITGQIAFDVYHAHKLVSRMSFPAQVQTDWISEAITLLELKSDRLTRVRRHSVVTASVMAAFFGILFAVNQARESGLAPISLLFFAVASCGMFAFLIAIGSFLGLIRSESKLSAFRRRLLDSVVVACGLVPMILAFRSWFWWVVGSSDAIARLPQAGELLAVMALAGFSATFIFESLYSPTP